MGRELPEEIKAELEKLKKNLEARGIRVERLVVFGSRVRGDYLENSDLDVIILSRDWEKISFPRRLQLIQECWESKTLGLDGFGYTPEEFERGKSFVLISQAVKEGIEA